MSLRVARMRLRTFLMPLATATALRSRSFFAAACWARGSAPRRCDVRARRALLHTHTHTHTRTHTHVHTHTHTYARALHTDTHGNTYMHARSRACAPLPSSPRRPPLRARAGQRPPPRRARARRAAATGAWARRRRRPHGYAFLRRRRRQTRMRRSPGGGDSAAHRPVCSSGVSSTNMSRLSIGAPAPNRRPPELPEKPDRPDASDAKDTTLREEARRAPPPPPPPRAGPPSSSSGASCIALSVAKSMALRAGVGQCDVMGGLGRGHVALSPGGWGARGPM